MLLAFFAFEPYDYFCLRGDATYLSKPLSTMREIKLGRAEDKLIFGDSRMANLNVDYIEQISGERYTMMAYGGSTFGEQMELFRYYTARAVPDKIVFELTFYMYQGTQDAGRIPVVKKQAESAWTFATDFVRWTEAGDMLRMKTKNALAAALGRKDMLEYPENPADYTLAVQVTGERIDGDRADLYEYSTMIAGALTSYNLQRATLAQLDELIDYCDANGVELIFVMPPMHETMFRRATGPAGIDPIRERLLEYVKGRATVYDMEFLNDYTRDEANFFDGFHLMPEQKKTLARLIFTDGDEHPEAIRRYVKD